jgi:hypothetical protein
MLPECRHHLKCHSRGVIYDHNIFIVQATCFRHVTSDWAQLLVKLSIFFTDRIFGAPSFGQLVVSPMDKKVSERKGKELY